MEKKGDANVFWILVFAILALVVLVVLGVIFGKGIVNVQTDFKGCTVRGGVCMPLSSGCTGDQFKIEGDLCPKKDNAAQVCCVSIKG